MVEKQNPVTYAENNLGVHAVWAEAQNRLQSHETRKDEYLKALSDVRAAEALITTREMELTADERGAHPDKKITEFRDHMKVVYEADGILSDLRGQLADAKERRDSAKADMDHHALGVGALTARMSELAGLLHFYAAAKQAATSAAPTA